MESPHTSLPSRKEPETGLSSLLNETQGYIVGRYNNQKLRYKTDAHLLTVAPTGEGKGTGLIIPNLLDHEGSAFVIDIRGETVAATAMIRRLMGQRVIILDPSNVTNFQYGFDRYNVMDALPKGYDDRNGDEKIKRFVKALMFDPDGRKSSEPIWDNATIEVITGIVTFLLRFGKKSEQNIREVLNIINSSDEELKRFVERVRNVVEYDEKGSKDQKIKGLLRMLQEDRDRTKIPDNAITQARTVLGWCGNQSFDDCLVDSTFSFDDFGDGNTTIYMIIPDEYIDEYAIWVRLVLQSAVFSIDDVKSTKGVSTSQLLQFQRTLFMLDELPSFGKLDIVLKGMPVLRGRGINLWLFVQNLAQLQEVYGKENARTIIGNSHCLQAFGVNELEELEYFVKLIGEDYFSVQTVGLNESETEGKSIAQGSSKTISSSRAFGQTVGTSDSIADAIGETWNESYTKGKQISQAKALARSRNEARTKSKNKGKGNSQSTNEGTGESKKVGFLGSSDRTENSNEGTSNTTNTNSSIGKSYTSSKSETETDSFTEGTNFGETKGTGGSKNTTNTRTTNNSTTETNTTSESDTTTYTETTNQSTTLGRSISVKYERLKIETVQSLRMKMSGGNQLIQIRNYPPFFIPKVKFFEKFNNQNRYLFPDMISKASTKSIAEVYQRVSSLQKLTLSDDIESEMATLEILSGYVSELDIYGTFETVETLDDVVTKTEPRKMINSWNEYIQGDLESFYERINVVDVRVSQLAKTIEEGAIIVREWSALLFSGGMNDFAFTSKSLVEKMENLSSLMVRNTKVDDILISKYRELPLAKIDSYGYRLGTRQTGDDYYSLKGNDLKRIIYIYRDVLRYLFNLLKDDLALKVRQITELDKARLWICEQLQLIQDSIEPAYINVMKRENTARNIYFQNNIKNF